MKWITLGPVPTSVIARRERHLDRVVLDSILIDGMQEAARRAGEQLDFEDWITGLNQVRR